MPRNLTPALRSMLATPDRQHHEHVDELMQHHEPELAEMKDLLATMKNRSPASYATTPAKTASQAHRSPNPTRAVSFSPSPRAQDELLASSPQQPALPAASKLFPLDNLTLSRSSWPQAPATAPQEYLSSPSPAPAPVQTRGEPEYDILHKELLGLLGSDLQHDRCVAHKCMCVCVCVCVCV